MFKFIFCNVQFPIANSLRCILRQYETDWHGNQIPCTFQGDENLLDPIALYNSIHFVF